MGWVCARQDGSLGRSDGIGPLLAQRFRRSAAQGLHRPDDGCAQSDRGPEYGSSRNGARHRRDCYQTVVPGDPLNGPFTSGVIQPP